MKKKIWTFLGYLYMPFYFIGFVLRMIARLVLAIAYALMLESNKAKDIIRYLW